MTALVWKADIRPHYSSAWPPNSTSTAARMTIRRQRSIEAAPASIARGRSSEVHGVYQWYLEQQQLVLRVVLTCEGRMKDIQRVEDVSDCESDKSAPRLNVVQPYC